MEFERIRVTLTLDLLQQVTEGRSGLPTIYMKPAAELLFQLKDEAHRLAYKVDALLIGEIQSRSEQIEVVEL